jgi:hypothetical protein
VAGIKKTEGCSMIAQEDIESRDLSFILSKIISHLVAVAEIIDGGIESNWGPEGDRNGIAISVIQEAVKDLNIINQALYSETSPVPMDESERPV